VLSVCRCCVSADCVGYHLDPQLPPLAAKPNFFYISRKEPYFWLSHKTAATVSLVSCQTNYSLHILMQTVRVIFGQRTTKTAITAAIYIQQDTEMSLRWKCIIT